MKKATLAILMALSVAMTLSGCGESSSASTDPNESSSSSANEMMNWNGITLYHSAAIVDTKTMIDKAINTWHGIKRKSQCRLQLGGVLGCKLHNIYEI